MGCGSSSSIPLVDNILVRDDIPGEKFTEELVPLSQFVRNDNSQRNSNILSWIPEDSSRIKACILISHGLHEHGLRYDNFAHALTARGYAVYAIDHIGHGRSDGVKALIPSFETLRDDFINFFLFVHEKMNPFRTCQNMIPYFVFAHSMGTLVALLSINSIVKEISILNNDADIPASILGLLLSGCPLFPGPAASSPFGIRSLYPISKTSGAKNMAKMLAAIDPLGPTAPIELEAITSDENELNVLLADSRRYPDQIRNKTALELLKMIKKVKKEIPFITLPLFCVHGEDDSIALVAGSQYVIDNYGGPENSKRLEILPHLKHELLHEKPEACREVTDMLIGFCERQFDIFNQSN